MMQQQRSYNFEYLKLKAKKREEARKSNGEYIIDQLKKAIQRGMGRNLLILGNPGTGKSWASMRLGEILDLNGFTIDKVCFTPVQFMNAIINSKKGDAIVYEEVGVNVSKRQWWKQFGQNALMQTVRYKNLFIIMNCPNLDFIDKPMTKLLHYSFNMLDTRKEDDGYTVMRPIRIDVDGQFGITKRMYPMVNGVLINQFIVKKPSLMLRRQYEEKHQKYKNIWNKRHLAQEQIKEKELRKELGLKE